MEERLFFSEESEDLYSGEQSVSGLFKSGFMFERQNRRSPPMTICLLSFKSEKGDRLVDLIGRRVKKMSETPLSSEESYPSGTLLDQVYG